MWYCIHCGHENNDMDQFCVHCGKPLESEEDKSNLKNSTNDSAQSKIENMSSSGRDMAEKVTAGAKKITKQVVNIVKETNKKVIQVQETVDDVIQQENEYRQAAYSDSALGAEYMSKTELWSWLKKKSDRKKYFTEQTSDMQAVDFMKKVNVRMKENGVPASIKAKKIQWDRSNVNRTIFYVEPMVKVANPLTWIVQFEHIGKFTFVEEKSFITPPNLPAVPMKPKPIDQKLSGQWKFLLVGIILVLYSCMSQGIFRFFAGEDGLAVLGFLGFGMGIYGLLGVIKLNDIKKYNLECMKQEAAWNAAWVNWQNTIFLHAFQEDINGHLSRIFDSVSACIKQISQEEFKDAVASVEEDTSANMNELEQLINRRKAEYR